MYNNISEVPLQLLKLSSQVECFVDSSMQYCGCHVVVLVCFPNISCAYAAKQLRPKKTIMKKGVQYLTDAHLPNFLSKATSGNNIFEWQFSNRIKMVIKKKIVFD